jgi:outer membrane protein assembly factor BamB
MSLSAARAQSQPSEALAFFPLAPSWRLSLNTQLTSPPLMAGSLGYFPLEGDRLAAYDLEHGTLLWLVSSKPRSQPAVGDGLVFVAEEAALIALSKDTGAVVWRIPFEQPPGTLVWDNGRLIAATSAGGIWAFRALKGDLLWQRNVEGSVTTRPAVASDRLYVPIDDGRLVAMRTGTGEPLWERRIGGRPSDILALESRIYVGSTDNYFYAIDAFTGAIAWRWPTGADVIGLPITDGQRVYFVSMDNVTRALDLRNGAQRWKRGLTLRPTRGPVRAGETLIVSGLAQTVFAYWLKDGTPAGDISAGGELAAPPHILTGGLPTLVMVTTSLTEGTMVRAWTRLIEPAIVPLAPLPNPTPLTPPPAPSSASRR